MGTKKNMTVFESKMDKVTDIVMKLTEQLSKNRGEG